MKLRHLLLERKVRTNLDSILKSIDFANKGPSSQGYGFSNGHVWMWELDYKESQVPKNWCFWTVVLEKTLESSLDCKEIQPVHPKGDQSWIFIGRTDAEAETPILRPPDAKNWLICKVRCWERLKAGGEGDDRGWAGWMASPPRWTWVWVNFGSWWWTGRPGVLQSMGSQRVGYDWATELRKVKFRWSQVPQEKREKSLPLAVYFLLLLGPLASLPRLLTLSPALRLFCFFNLGLFVLQSFTITSSTAYFFHVLPVED